MVYKVLVDFLCRASSVFLQFVCSCYPCFSLAARMLHFHSKHIDYINSDFLGNILLAVLILWFQFF